jgi:dipeptidyl aminopeptidase/acylaminoacyl peptidase
VISVGIDQARKHVSFVANQNAYMKLHVLDAKTLEKIEVPLPEDADHTYSGFMTRDGRHMMVAVETAQAPRSSFSYDFVTKKITRWVIPSLPEVDTKRFVRAELMEYTARDGTKIPMFVRKPAACDRRLCPVVVHFHGGPEGQSLPGFSVFAQLFVDEGFIFVEPNVRGSEGYGQMWLHSDNGPKRLKVITDIQDAATELKKIFAVGGKAPKLGVMGWSYGGYSTLFAMTKFAGSYDAGVALVGMSNLVTFLQNTAPYRRALRIPEYGDPEKDKEALLELSPVTHLALLKSPLMIIQGAEDPRVPVGEAVSFFDEMQAKEIPGSLIIFADEGHGTQKRSNQVLELGSTIDFFRQNLKMETRN